MLNELLDLLRSKGTYRVSELAEELDTTPVMVEQMLEDLERWGYLKRVDASCPGSCKHCPVAGLCAAGSGGRLWSLTEKGRTTERGAETSA